MLNVKKDSMRLRDSIILNGKYVKTDNHGSRLLGVLEVYKGTGEVIFTKGIYLNDILLNGSNFFLEKATNMRSNFNPTSIDVDLGINSSITRTVETLKEESIVGICIGVGGCTNTYNTIKTVQRHHKVVPTIIPFRLTSTDLTGTERSKYFLRKTDINSNIIYYGKKFETPGVIKTLFDDDTEVPNNVDTLIDPKPINNYIEYKVVIGSNDVREYFINTEGSTTNSRVNSIGLLTGYPVVKPDATIEYENVRCITTMNMENQDLKDSESTITVIYKLVCI